MLHLDKAIKCIFSCYLYTMHKLKISFPPVGDSGYPLEPWLLTPFSDPGTGTVQETFNKRHASARNTVERCNGLLKSRFRCLSQYRVLHYTPTKAASITNACAVLIIDWNHHRVKVLFILMICC